MRILLTNDDGVYAEGLKALQDELKKLGEVWVVAPLVERSTTGHSLTIHKPLRIVPLSKSRRIYAINGSPADCVYLGIRQIVKNPDVVISGINCGANLGQDVYYSGTVAAAREAAIYRVPSVAVSLNVDFRKPSPHYHYESAAKIVRQVICSLDLDEIPEHTMLNLNVPDRPFQKIRGVELTHQGFQHYTGTVLKRQDHRGKDYYWIGGKYRGFKRELGSDCYAVHAGYAALTPLKLDCTDVHYLTGKLRGRS